jgi:hypothetical protein
MLKIEEEGGEEEEKKILVIVDWDMMNKQIYI